jgi:hypothetical protein
VPCAIGFSPSCTIILRRRLFAVLGVMRFVTGLARIVANDPLRDHGRLVAAFALDGHVPRRLRAVPRVLHPTERDSGANAEPEGTGDTNLTRLSP